MFPNVGFQNPPRRRYAAYGSTFAAAASAGATAIYARADVAYARSFLTQTHLKGTIGEFFAERFFLNNQLEQSIRGNWIALNPRTGPQGFDHLFLRVGKNGRLYWMVGESKYGTSQLGVTVNGTRQMSTDWISKRAHELGNRYLAIGSEHVELKQLPEIVPSSKVDVVLEDYKTVVSFWKDGNDNWYFSGTSDQLETAREMAVKMGSDLLSTGCSIRGRIFHIVAEGNNLRISLYNVRPGEILKGTTLNQLQPDHVIEVPDVLNGRITDEEFCKIVAASLKNKFPNLTEAELKDAAEDILKKYKAGEFLVEPRPVWQSIALQSLAAAGIAGVMDLGMQLVMTRRVQVGHVVLTAGSAGIGAASGQLIGIVLMSTKIGSESVRSISSFLNLTSGMTRTALSGLGGGAITTLLMAYGSLAMGYCDLKQANRMAVSGIIGTVASTAVGVGVPATVSSVVFGSLHGAAAANATMAWLGFGSLANGGLGMAGGAVLLGGYAVIAGIAVSALASYGYRLYDENDNRKYLLLLADRYEGSGAWERIAGVKV